MINLASIFKLPNGAVEAAKVKLTVEGGIAVKLTNKTGAASVKGTVIEVSTTTDDAFAVCPADGDDAFGVVYETGIADGSECWIIVSGIAEVLLEDSTAATRGYWARTSITQAGRIDATTSTPPGGGIPEIDQHLTEVGHCLQSVSSGTDVLARCVLHFN